MDAPTPGTMKRDLVSAYLAAGMRIAAWVVVSALVFRHRGESEFAMLALVRATVGLLAYAAVGLAPALIHSLASVASSPDATQRHAKLYCNGLAAAILAGAIAALVTFAYARNAEILLRVPITVREYIGPLALTMGLGMVARLISDVPSAVLQTRGRIGLDQLLLAAAEAVWVGLVALLPLNSDDALVRIGQAFALAGVALALARFVLAAQIIGFVLPDWRSVDLATMGRLVFFGGLVVAAQLADFLYAPTDYIVINRLLHPDDVAIYAPAVQIDAGLLVLVAALGTVLLPKTALASAAGDRRLIRRYYLTGTAASTAVLLVGGTAVWQASPIIFRLWLGNPMPATQAILPLVLIHTIVGGSSAVGRSVLLGMGRVQPFAASVLIAGIANVLLSITFVAYFKLGLRGIVYGTIVAVVGRCLLWMPWYVLRTIRSLPAHAR